MYLVILITVMQRKGFYPHDA